MLLPLLVICLCLGSHAHAEDIDSTNATPPPTELERELAKIATTCFSWKDVEDLMGNVYKYGVAEHLSYEIIRECAGGTIGNQELRTVLGLHELPPWKPYNETKPSEQELASATTIEEYYNLKEPRLKPVYLNSDYLSETNINTAVAFLDKRLPSIRAVYRRAFEDACPVAPKVLDKKKIDDMIDLYLETANDLIAATSRIYYDRKCPVVE